MIEVVPDASFAPGTFAALVESANVYQDRYTFTLREGFGELASDDSIEIGPDDAFDQLVKKEWFDDQAYYILVSQRRLEDNFLNARICRVQQEFQLLVITL